VAGLLVALAGLVLGLLALFVLPWGDGDVSFLDLRDAVADTAPLIGAIPIAFLLIGALFEVIVGGVVAVARALGAAPLRIIAAVVVVLGVAALAVLGFTTADIEGAGEATPSGSETTVPAQAQPGATITVPDGSPVTDPSSGAPLTVPDGGQTAGPSTGDVSGLMGSALDEAEDRLTAGALVGTAVMVVAAVLAVVGLLLKRTAGHLLTAAGLGVMFLWTAGAIGLLVTKDDVSDLGLGAYAIVASALLLAVSAAIPARRRTT
jgi:hypothetical protein